MASADQVIRALDKGAPVVVIAQLFQVNPLQWIYRQSAPPINNLSDLKGRTIGVTYGGNDETIMRTLLAKAGLDAPDVKLFNVRYDYTPFYRGQVDIWPVYRNTQGIVIGRKMQADNDPVRFFIPAGFGVKFVANSVVTSQKMVQRNPETVRRFIRALLAGWEKALNPVNAERHSTCCSNSTGIRPARFWKSSSPLPARWSSRSRPWRSARSIRRPGSRPRRSCAIRTRSPDLSTSKPCCIRNSPFSRGRRKVKG